MCTPDIPVPDPISIAPPPNPSAEIASATTDSSATGARRSIFGSAFTPSGIRGAGRAQTPRRTGTAGFGTSAAAIAASIQRSLQLGGGSIGGGNIGRGGFSTLSRVGG